MTDLKQLLLKFLPILRKLQRYVVLVVFLGVVAACSFLLLRIGTLVNSEPSEDAVDEKLQTVKRPRIDEDAAKKIQQLEDENVEIQALFQQARDNPFQE